MYTLAVINLYLRTNLVQVGQEFNLCLCPKRPFRRCRNDRGQGRGRGGGGRGGSGGVGVGVLVGHFLEEVEGGALGDEEEGAELELPLDGEVLDAEVLLPVVGEGLVELAVLLGDVVGVPCPLFLSSFF